MPCTTPLCRRDPLLLSRVAWLSTSRMPDSARPADSAGTSQPREDGASGSGLHDYTVRAWADNWTWPLSADDLLSLTASKIYVPLLAHSLGRGEVFPRFPMFEFLPMTGGTDMCTFSQLVEQQQEHLERHHPTLRWEHIADETGYVEATLQELYLSEDVRMLADSVMTALARPVRSANMHGTPR